MSMGFDGDGNLYVELNAPLSVGGNDYNMRLTRTSAGRSQESDEITCHVDYQRISDSVSGRFEDHVFPTRSGQGSLPYLQGQFQAMLNNDTPVASPVYP
jgi:hypothetical protein